MKYMPLNAKGRSFIVNIGKEQPCPYIESERRVIIVHLSRNAEYRSSRGQYASEIADFCRGMESKDLFRRVGEEEAHSDNDRFCIKIHPVVNRSLCSWLSRGKAIDRMCHCIRALPIVQSKRI